MNRGAYLVIHGFIAATGAYLSTKLGLLYPVLIILGALMVADYISGMLASKTESINHPGDPDYGWSSKKGAIGIMKKVGYLFIIGVAVVVDFLILCAADVFGIQGAPKAFWGILVAIWYILNELLSIIENVGRMGAYIPEWLRKYIAALKHKIDTDEHGDGL